MVWVTITVVIEKRKHFRILFYSNHVVYESKGRLGLFLENSIRGSYFVISKSWFLKEKN